jgi:hypothetical protein
VAAIHEPGPGSFNDPSSREDLEAGLVDLLDDLDAEVVVAAVLEEGALEPAVTPQLRETPRAGSGQVRSRDAAGVVEVFAVTTTTAMSSPRVSTMPKVLRPLIFLPASKPLLWLGTVDAARTLRASMIPAVGPLSRPSALRTAAARRAAMRSQVPSRDHCRCMRCTVFQFG